MNPNIEAFNAELARNNTGTRFETGRGVITIPKKTPVTTPQTPTPTITTPNRTPGLLDQARNNLVDANASRASARQQAETYAAAQRQARIDAINTTFAPRIQREKVEGEGRMSRVAALNFKSGIVGSGADTTKTGEQTNLNNKALQAIEDEKATAINEAFGWADQLARQRAEDIFNETKDSAEANVARYKERADTANNALKVFGSQNVTAEQLKSVDPKTYETLRDVSGMSDAEIDAYLKVNAPEGTYQWNAAQINGSKMVVPKVTNGKVTMETLDMGFSLPKNKEVQTTVKTDDGVYIIYKDGTTSLIGGGKKTVDNTIPTWQEYLSAADKASHAEESKKPGYSPYDAEVDWTQEEINTLRDQYEKEYMGKSNTTVVDNSDYTSTEKKKLEQAGLLKASRQEQLDFLYGDTGISNPF